MQRLFIPLLLAEGLVLKDDVYIVFVFIAQITLLPEISQTNKAYMINHKFIIVMSYQAHQFNQICYQFPSLISIIIKQIILKQKMSKVCIILLLLSLPQIVRLHYFTVSTNDKILLNQDYTGISAVSKDLDGKFLVGFLDGTARKYAADFSTYVSISLPDIVNLFETRQILLTVQISNGTLINMNSRKTTIIFSNYTTVRDYHYDTLALEQTIHLNETIIYQYGLPITVSNLSYTYHVLICNNSVTVTYRGLTVVYSFSTFFAVTGVCRSAALKQLTKSPGTDIFRVAHLFYIGIESNLYLLFVKLNFQFNTTSNHFDLVWGLSSFQMNLTHAYACPLDYLSIANNEIVLMQSNSSGSIYIFDIDADSAGTTTGISNHQIFSFFYVHQGFYLIQSTGILALDYNYNVLNLFQLALVKSLPLSSYGLAIGNPISAFYTPGLPYMYKGGFCPGQKLYQSEQDCGSFVCASSSCTWCPFSPNMCSVCASGFILDYTYTCRPNNTVLNNTTPSNNTSPINNTSPTNNTLPTSNSALAIDYYKRSFFQLLLQFLLTIFKSLISIPAARRVASPAFYFFSIFDDMYFFQFHDRLYGQTMTTIFENLNDIQEKKWSMVNYEVILDWLNADLDKFQEVTDYQRQYDDFHFTDKNHKQMSTEGLWSNCQNYFLAAFPITITAFLFGKVLFRIFFDWRISKIFRKFEFWPLLILLLLDGNIQQFSFYLATGWKNMFFFSISSKAVKLQLVLFGFFIILVSSGLYFLSYIFYNKPNRHIMDNNKNNVSGQASLILQFGLRNCYLGVMNSYLRVLSYRHMLIVMLISQVAFASCFAASLALNIYESNLKMCLFILLNFTKVVLMITLFIDYSSINLPIIEMVQQALVIIVIGLFLVGSLIQMIQTLRDLLSIIRQIIRLDKDRPKYLKDQLSKKGVSIYVENVEVKGDDKDRKIRSKFKPRRYITYLNKQRINANSMNKS